LSLADHGIDVKFTDDSIMSVQPQNLLKCDLIPVGCEVLARSAVSDWYELAIIQSYYTDSLFTAARLCRLIHWPDISHAVLLFALHCHVDDGDVYLWVWMCFLP